MRRGTGPANTSSTTRSADAVAHPGQRLAGVSNLHRHLHSAGERQPVADHGSHLVGHLDRTLPGAGPGGGDVPGQRQSAGTQVHDRQRLPGLGHQVDDVTQAPDVLEHQVRRVVDVDVGLRRAVDGEQEAGPAVGVGLDRDVGGRAAGYSVPLVEGTPVTRASSATASRSARATALNCASTRW